MTRFCISKPVEIYKTKPSGDSFLIEKIPVGIKEQHLTDRIIEGFCSYDQILQELLKEDNLL